MKRYVSLPLLTDSKTFVQTSQRHSKLQETGVKYAGNEFLINFQILLLIFNVDEKLRVRPYMVVLWKGRLVHRRLFFVSTSANMDYYN